MNTTVITYIAGASGVVIYEVLRVYQWITQPDGRDLIYKRGHGIFYFSILLCLTLVAGVVALAVDASLGWKAVFVGYTVPSGMGNIIRVTGASGGGPNLVGLAPPAGSVPAGDPTKITVEDVVLGTPKAGLSYIWYLLVRHLVSA